MPKRLPKRKFLASPLIGEVIIFPLEVEKDHNAPFGVGRILSITDGKKIDFQWLGNQGYDYGGTLI